MNSNWIVALSCLTLVACGGEKVRRADTFDRVNQEMTAAASTRATNALQNPALSQAMLPPLQLEPPPPSPVEPRFDLAVSNAAVGQVLTALVSGTPYSIVFPPEVAGNVSLNLKNVTVREALDTLRDLYGYDYRLQGTRIFVQPNTAQTRIFRINYLANRRQGISEMRVTGSSPTTSGGNTNGTGASGNSSGTGTPGSGNAGRTGQYASDSARVSTSSDYNFWEQLQNALTTIVTGNGNEGVVNINSVSGVVLVKALPHELRSVQEYLKATQLIVERQVMLEAKIIEVELNDSYQTGINWSKFGGASNRFSFGIMAPGTALSSTAALLGTVAGGSVVNAQPGAGGGTATSNAGQGFFGLAFQSNDFAALLSFLEGQGDVQVLSSPRIATTNNQKAVLKVGNDDYFVTGISTNTTTSTTGNVVSPNITLQPFFSGIALDVTPQIDEDGNIILHVHPSVSVVQEKTKNVNLGDLGNFTLPLASSNINESDSIVRVQDGSIVAIGGLMSQRQSSSRNGLPGLSSLPGLGAAFGQKEGTYRKRELVILMRSTIIHDENSWREELAESQSRIQGLSPRQQRRQEW
jgi:MSHA biogenesis protein MshL